MVLLNCFQVALSGLENILRFGQQDAKETGVNVYAVTVEECYGLDKIEFLQSHENLVTNYSYHIGRQRFAMSTYK